MDTADNPQRSVNYRNIHGRSLRRQAEIFAKSDTWQTTSVFEDEEVKEINLKKTALSVQVYSRRNSSIQGELYIDPDKRVFFRSGIELIRMLYEYLDSMERKNC